MVLEPSQAVAKATALANGLRKSVVMAGRGWRAWPRGPEHLAQVVACIDRIRQRMAPARGTCDEATLETCVADLRAVLEWTTYQSASLRAARALVVARRTRSLAGRLGLLDERAPALALLGDAEGSLTEIVRVRCAYMTALAERHPHLGLPPPLVDPAALAERPQRPPGRLGLIQELRRRRSTPGGVLRREAEKEPGDGR